MRRRTDDRERTGRGAGAVIAVAIVAALAACPAHALTPLEIATAGADIALATGLDAMSANPALLAATSSHTTQIRLVNIAAALGNNSLAWSDYSRYNGAVLEEDEKASILADIPQGGLLADAEVGASALAFRCGGWGVAVSGLGTAQGRLDRDVIDLLLHGNAEKPDWRFARSGGEALAAAKLSVSHGRSIAHIGGHPLCAGITLSLIRGLYYAQASDVEADLSTLTTGLTGGGTADCLTATGGWGWSADAGLTWEPAAGTRLSAAVENAISTIRWNGNVELRHYDFAFNNVTIEDYDDSLWESHETRESRPPVSRTLPAVVRVGAAHSLGSSWRCALAARAALADRLGMTTRPQVAGAVEYMLWSVIPLRAGVAVGGSDGYAVGAGTGLHWGLLSWDVGVRFDHAVWLTDSRGVTGAMAIDLNL